MSESVRQILEPLSPLALEQILQEPLNAQVLTSLRLFAQTIALYGYKPQVASTKSLLRLAELSPDKKIQIRDYYNNWRQWIQPMISEAELSDGELISEYKEVTFAKRAMNFYGIRADEEFWTTVRPHDVIEIYGHDMIQLYRSLTFFQYCGYSLLDISVFEWYVLWERPRMIIDKMIDYARTYLTIKHPTAKFDIPPHVLRETMDTGLTSPFNVRACRVEFRNIASLSKGLSAEPGGFICTATGEIIAEGRDALNIQFV